MMTTVDEIEAAVWALSPADRADLLRRVDMTLVDGNHGFVDQNSNDAWDRQMIADAKAGRLDAMIAEADANMKAGRIRPMPCDRRRPPPV